MSLSRGEFSSRLGFIMAAAGSAVGLGNIWGFPTQAASNGGAAFLLVYVVLAFVLAYPALMAELIIGRHAHANAVKALRTVSSGLKSRRVGSATGISGLIIASLILSFYAILAGWMLVHCLASLATIVGLEGVERWLLQPGFTRNFVFTVIFIGLTVTISAQGVREGIERWSSRLMPLLVIALVLLVIYVLSLEGAMEGVGVYLIPDFKRVLSPVLIIDALGAAFFSLSLGVGTMLIYGSYIKDSENLPVVGGLVTLVDIAIAILAGFLVLPAMYVALHNGVEIFSPAGDLISEDTLIFTVLPQLFHTMGMTGSIVSLVFFALMAIAALTSSVSMLEVPVAYSIEELNLDRSRAVIIIGGLIALASTVILLDLDRLLGLVVTLTTQYGQPLLGVMYCLYAGWVWRRDELLRELCKGCPEIEHSLFWRIWPWYVRVVCPLIILAIFMQSLFGE